MDIETSHINETAVLPAGWNIKQLDEVAFVTSGKRLPLGHSLTDHNTPHPYIRVTDMRPGTVCLDDLKFVPVNVAPAIKRYRIFSDDLFISVAGTLGIVGKIPSAVNGANLTENADRITNITCSQNYLLYVLMSSAIQNIIESLRTVGAQPKLALERIREFPIPLPPTRREQEAIAEALSDADAYVESLEQLSAKKRLVKQGAMQELLTGQRRLPGFESRSDRKHTNIGLIPEEWGCKTVGDIASRVRNAIVGGPFGSDLVSKDYVNEGVPVIRGQNMGRKFVSGSFAFVSPSKANSLEANLARPGDLIFTQRGTLGQVCLVPDMPHERYLISQSQMKVTVDGSISDSQFLYYLFNGPEQQGAIRENTIQTGVPHINLGILRSLTIPLPPIAEQRSISTVLREMDDDLSALEAKLDKARNIKQGMMQNLLTGRIRLV